jgi:hypothetical protein
VGLGNSESIYNHKVIVSRGVSAIIVLKGTPMLGFDFRW